MLRLTAGSALHSRVQKFSLALGKGKSRKDDHRSSKLRAFRNRLAHGRLASPFTPQQWLDGEVDARLKGQEGRTRETKLLAPDFLVYPENGAISTFKGFEIIVIGGLGSVLGSIVGGVLLGVIEALGSVFLSAAYKDLYGFLLLIALLVFRPTGLFGERGRSV